MSSYFLGWSLASAFLMVELHGETSTEGIELAKLFSDVCNIIVTYRRLDY
jgi:hypothetical protein